MNWFSRLFGGKQEPVASQPSRSLAGRNVALAVVDNPGGAVILDMSGGGAAGGVTEKMIRDFIQKDLARSPELRAHAAAIQGIAVVTDESISSSNYAQDMTQAYLKHMRQDGWARPGGLHIFETHVAHVTVYIAYGT
jgi:hypothetical protein